MTWEEQQRLIVKVELKYIRLVAARIQQIYQDGLTAYKDGKLQDVHNKFFDDQLLTLIRAIHVNAGVPMARFIYRSMPKKRELKGGQMGISEQWLANVKNYLERHALQFVTNIVGTLRDDMLALFDKAVTEGWSYEYLANQLLNTGLAVRRARVIARTEAHRGAMKGGLEGANSLPYEVQKQWLSASDNRVRVEPKDRFDHRQLSGQIRELDQPFTNEENIQFPGDPQASPGNTIQCRCVLNYIPKRDEKGMVIMK